MKAKITSEILKEHFNCAYKTYLKFSGECGEKTEFQELLYEKENIDYFVSIISAEKNSPIIILQ